MNDSCVVPLSQGKVSVVSPETFEEISKWKWSASLSEKGRYYAIRKDYSSKKRKTIYMHREILGLKAGDSRQVDHINHDTLDNRLSNIRIATQSQNNANRHIIKPNKTGFAGVCAQSRGGNYFSQVKVNGKKVYLGTFSTAEEAHARYMEARNEWFGEFAYVGRGISGRHGQEISKIG